MNIEKMRDQFEEAAKSRWPDGRNVLLRINQPGTPADGQYENPVVHNAWWAWQASRQAIEIDLPAPNTDYSYTDRDINGACEHFRRAKAAIESVGLRIKK